MKEEFEGPDHVLITKKIKQLSWFHKNTLYTGMECHIEPQKRFLLLMISLYYWTYPLVSSGIQYNNNQNWGRFHELNSNSSSSNVNTAFLVIIIWEKKNK